MRAREYTHEQWKFIGDGINSLMLFQDLRKSGHWDSAGKLMDHLIEEGAIMKADASFRGQPVEVVK